MLTNPTLEQMQRLGLHGMVAAYRDLAEQANELGHEDWLALMLDREETVRADKRLANRLRAAKLRFPEACIEDIDYAVVKGGRSYGRWRPRRERGAPSHGRNKFVKKQLTCE